MDVVWPGRSQYFGQRDQVFGTMKSSIGGDQKKIIYYEIHVTTVKGVLTAFYSKTLKVVLTIIAS